LKLANCLQVKAIYVFLTIVFKENLLPYLKLTITCVKKDTLIEHKEAVVVCEESGLISLNYNVLLITLEANIVTKHVAPILIAKSSLTCTNCSKTSHTLETYHNKKREVLVAPTTIMRSTKLVAKTKTQPSKLGRIPIHYPCIICYSVEHRSRECPKKIKVQNMFNTKSVSSNTKNNT
jgi:hypothetical protein